MRQEKELGVENEAARFTEDIINFEGIDIVTTKAGVRGKTCIKKIKRNF